MKKVILFFFLCVFLNPCNIASPVYAGGALVVVPTTGVPAAWESPISIHPEAGSCASFTNAAMVAKVVENISIWEDVENASVAFLVVEGSISADVDGDNYNSYYADAASDAGASDDKSPIIFDDDGEIISALFGNFAEFTILGFAGSVSFSTDYTMIEEGQAVINCRCLGGNAAGDCDAGIVFSEDDLDFTILHEMGHFLNLDHTQVNQSIAGGACNTAVTGDCDDLPTMYPQAVDAADQLTLTQDDQIALLRIYGTDKLESNYCQVTGTLTDASGTALKCADVQGIALATADTVSVVTGQFSPRDDVTFECSSDCGVFALKGLQPGKTYTVTVKPIDSSWVNASSVGPCTTSQVTGIVEEEIASVTSCTGGQVIELGTVATASDIADDASADDGSDDSSDESDTSAATCGSSQNFANCEEMISCSLRPYMQIRQSRAAAAIFFLVLLTLFISKKYLGKRPLTSPVKQTISPPLDAG